MTDEIFNGYTIKSNKKTLSPIINNIDKFVYQKCICQPQEELIINVIGKKLNITFKFYFILNIKVSTTNFYVIFNKKKIILN